MLFVEADNALGSRLGDVDDGLAVAAVLASGLRPVLGSVFGNTTEPEADRNNRALAAVLGRPVRHVRGSTQAGERDAEAVDLLCASRGATILALGPLTTLAAALGRQPDLAAQRVVVVGGDLTSRGRWPPLWPHEFNLSLDRAAAVTVFTSTLPLTVVPLDVGRRLLVPRRWLEALPGRAGAHLAAHAKRRLARNRRWLRIDALRGYDLLAAAAVFCPAAVETVSAPLSLHPRGFLRRGRGRSLEVVVDFDGRRILADVAAALAQAERDSCAPSTTSGTDAAGQVASRNVFGA